MQDRTIVLEKSKYHSTHMIKQSHIHEYSIFNVYSLKKMSSLVFMRHGQAENNIKRVFVGRSPGISLTDLGKRQAKYAAKLLEHFDISVIYSSPIERTYETAKIVGKYTSLEVIKDERLTEREMGTLFGNSYDSMDAKYGNVSLKFWQRDPEIARQGVETFDQIRDRMIDMRDHALRTHPGKNILFVSHSEPIKVMISTMLDLTPKELTLLDVGNTSLTVFKEHDPGEFSMHLLNFMGHGKF